MFSSVPSESYLTVWPRKWCQPPKPEIKSNYETRPSCTPVDKTEIKKIFCDYCRYITICYLNQQNHRQKFKNLQKQDTALWVCLTHPIEKTVSICCYCECLSGYNKIKLIFLLCLVCLVLIKSIILKYFRHALEQYKTPIW